MLRKIWYCIVLLFVFFAIIEAQEKELSKSDRSKYEKSGWMGFSQIIISKYFIEEAQENYSVVFLRKVEENINWSENNINDAKKIRALPVLDSLDLVMVGLKTIINFGLSNDSRFRNPSMGVFLQVVDIKMREYFYLFLKDIYGKKN